MKHFDSLAAAKGWTPGASQNGALANGHRPPPMDIEKIFGESVFGLAEMKARLPKPVYKALISTIEQQAPLDPAVADAVALGMKEWAI
jgi:glutamine synthetase